MTENRVREKIAILMRDLPCSKCEGFGKVLGQKGTILFDCPTCQGTGKRTRPELKEEGK